MAQVAAAVGTDDFGSYGAKASVLMSSNRTRDAVKIRRPATARVKLVSCLVERRIASSASVDTLFGVVLVILSTVGSFS
jgi:hypothetical protein